MKRRRPRPRPVRPLWACLRASSLCVPDGPLRLLVQQHARGGISARLPGFNPVLWLYVQPMDDGLDYGDLSLAVDWQGECIDLLVSLDAKPEPHAGGYRCALCEPDQAVWHADLSSFWEAELFGLFAQWAREELLPARVLSLWRSDGASWASLHGEADPRWFDNPALLAVLPVRDGSAARRRD